MTASKNTDHQSLTIKVPAPKAEFTLGRFKSEAKPDTGGHYDGMFFKVCKGNVCIAALGEDPRNLWKEFGNRSAFSGIAAGADAVVPGGYGTVEGIVEDVEAVKGIIKQHQDVGGLTLLGSADTLIGSGRHTFAFGKESVFIGAGDGPYLTRLAKGDGALNGAKDLDPTKQPPGELACKQIEAGYQTSKSIGELGEAVMSVVDTINEALTCGLKGTLVTKGLGLASAIGKFAVGEMASGGEVDIYGPQEVSITSAKAVTAQSTGSVGIIAGQVFEAVATLKAEISAIGPVELVSSSLAALKGLGKAEVVGGSSAELASRRGRVEVLGKSVGIGSTEQSGFGNPQKNTADVNVHANEGIELNAGKDDTHAQLQLDGEGGLITADSADGVSVLAGQNVTIQVGRYAVEVSAVGGVRIDEAVDAAALAQQRQAARDACDAARAAARTVKTAAESAAQRTWIQGNANVGDQEWYNIYYDALYDATRAYRLACRTAEREMRAALRTIAATRPARVEISDGKVTVGAGLAKLEMDEAAVTLDAGPLPLTVRAAGQTWTFGPLGLNGPGVVGG